MTDDPGVIDMTGDEDITALLEGFAVSGAELLQGQERAQVMQRRIQALLYALSFHTDGGNDPMTTDAGQIARTAVTFDKFLKDGTAPVEVTNLRVVDV